MDGGAWKVTTHGAEKSLTWLSNFPVTIINTAKRGSLYYVSSMLEKTHESPLDCTDIKSVNPKGNLPESSLEGLMLKLKQQYYGHLMQRTDIEKDPWRWERLKAGGEGDDRGWDGLIASPTQWTWVEPAPGDSEGQGSLGCYNTWGCKELDMTEGLNRNKFWQVAKGRKQTRTMIFNHVWTL